MPTRTFKSIGNALGLPEKKVNRIFKRGMKKLEKRKDNCIVIPTLYACAEDCHPELQAGSVECDKEFIKIYGEKRRELVKDC